MLVCDRSVTVVTFLLDLHNLSIYDFALWGCREPPISLGFEEEKVSAMAFVCSTPERGPASNRPRLDVSLNVSSIQGSDDDSYVEEVFPSTMIEDARAHTTASGTECFSV